MQMICPRCGWQGDDARYCARCGADLSAAGASARAASAGPAQAAPALAPPPSVVATRPAGFWIRFVAVMIDGFVLLLVQGVLFGAGWMIFGGGMGVGMALRGVGHLFGTLIGAVYSIAFHWTWGQTLGKMALQIRVVSLDGGPLSFGQAVGRYFATYLSAIILGIGFIMAGVRSDKRALHDLLAGTRVQYL